jgi:DNA-binding Lrp family transcriptional regulator
LWQGEGDILVIPLVIFAIAAHSSAEMDETDRKLLSLLRRDARASLSELADALGVTRATVRARIERMRARGEIEGFTVVTRGGDEAAPVRGLMMLAIEGAGAGRLTERLLGWPEVVAVHSTNGRWDLIVEIGTDTLAALDRVLAEIRAQPGVRSSETSLLLTTRRGAGGRP